MKDAKKLQIHKSKKKIFRSIRKKVVLFGIFLFWGLKWGCGLEDWIFKGSDFI